MKKLLILGAGGCGREVFQWAKDMNKEKAIWTSIRFLDDDLHQLDRLGMQDKIEGKIHGYQPCAGEEVICAIGDPVIRLALCNDFKKKGAIFTNIIHPTVIIADYSHIGTGVIICPRSIISTNVRVDDFVLINTFCVAGHDVIIEQGCTLSAQCDLMGGVHLEEGVFLGSGARVFPNMRVGKQAKIGGGSVVIRNVPAMVSVFGNPAKQIY